MFDFLPMELKKRVFNKISKYLSKTSPSILNIESKEYTSSWSYPFCELEDETIPSFSIRLLQMKMAEWYLKPKHKHKER